MASTSDSALVLLCTFNGARFLNVQVDSILRQKGVSLQILIRDDQSTDGSLQILDRLEHQHKNIHIVRDTSGRLGYSQNFSRLMLEARRRSARYVFLCDQDDIWHPHKSSQQLSVLRQMEDTVGADFPCLTHSDLQLIDSAGRVIAGSLLRRRKARFPDPTRALSELIAANYVTGCTVAMNRALLEIAEPVPSSAKNHDHWIALCAAACGKIFSQTEPLVSYRQHAFNVIGARSLWATTLHNPTQVLTKIFRSLEDMRQLSELIQVLEQRCGSRAPDTTTHLLAVAAKVAACNYAGFRRYIEFRRHSIYPTGWERSLLWFTKNILT